MTICLKSVLLFKNAARKKTKRIFTNSEGWNVNPAIVIDRFAPYVSCPITRTTPKNTIPEIPYKYVRSGNFLNLHIIIGIINAISDDALTIINCLTERS